MYTSGAKACGYIIPQEKRRNLGAPTQVDCCAEEVHSACFVWDEKYFPSSPPSLPPGTWASLDAAHPHRDSRLAGRQGLHLESVICVPGGCAEPLVNSIVPFSSPPLLSLLPNLTVRLAHLVLLQGRVNGVVGVLSSLLVSPALLKVCSSPGAQHIVFISVPMGQFIIHIVLAQQQLWFRGLAKLWQKPPQKKNSTEQEAK